MDDVLESLRYRRAQETIGFPTTCSTGT